MKRIIVAFILSVILVGMSIPALAEEHGRGGERGHGYARGHEREYHGRYNRGYYNQRHYYAAPVYAPPPVYYAPNPYPPPGITFVIPFHIR